ncbi:MAG TPA: hypothetical protein VGL46_21540 [Pseudonocardiaceae bacterium]|jgi:hypothetical protein
MSWGGILLAGAAGVIALVVLTVVAVLALHIRSARRRSDVVFARLYQPLPRGPLPPLDTNPDGPRSAPLRPWNTSRSPE